MKCRLICIAVWAVLLISCRYGGPVEVERRASSRTGATESWEDRAKLHPVARYGGYVLTATGMPHGEYRAYLWAKNMGTLVAFETFLRRYPEGTYAEAFRQKIREVFVPEEEDWVEAWALYSKMEVIEGAICDANEGFILIGRPGSGKMSPFFYEDLVTALECSLANERVGVTMNRIFPDRFRQGDQQARFGEYETSVEFYADNLRNSHLAYTLFEADRMLKSLSAGYDIFLREPVRSRIPGYKSQIEMEASLEPPENGSSGTGDYGRVWIELTSVQISTTEDGSAALFDNVQMEVRAESQHEPPIRFARHLQDNYEEFSEEFPIFGEVERAARIVAIARWLTKRYPEQAQDLVDDAYEKAQVFVPQVIRARADITHSSATAVRALIGGVVFPRNNKYAVAPESRLSGTTLKDLPRVVLNSRPNEASRAWVVSLGDQKRTKYIAWNISHAPSVARARIQHEESRLAWAGVR